jgi:sorbitol-specific phosphotransferase system component IIBC
MAWWILMALMIWTFVGLLVADAFIDLADHPRWRVVLAAVCGPAFWAFLPIFAWRRWSQ